MSSTKLTWTHRYINMHTLHVNTDIYKEKQSKISMRLFTMKMDTNIQATLPLHPSTGTVKDSAHDNQRISDE